MMPAVGCGRKAQPQVPKAVGRDLLTLEPLRALGPDALDTQAVPGIAKITLREIEITSENAFHEITIRRADDLFECAAAEGPDCQPIPATGLITRAVFDIEFVGSPNPVPLQISTPDVIIFPAACPVQLIQRWLRQRRFTDPSPPDQGGTGPPDADSVVIT
jgi:hypothetical protein